MDQILSALEKVGITGEVLKFAALLVAFFALLFGGAVLIAAATRNWPKQRWKKWNIPCILASMFVALVLTAGKPPASYVGALLVIFSFSIAIADPIRREYFAPKPEHEAKPQ